jgi:hypothetical protein
LSVDQQGLYCGIPNNIFLSYCPHAPLAYF